MIEDPKPVVPPYEIGDLYERMGVVINMITVLMADHADLSAIDSEEAQWREAPKAATRLITRISGLSLERGAIDSQEEIAVCVKFAELVGAVALMLVSETPIDEGSAPTFDEEDFNG